MMIVPWALPMAALWTRALELREILFNRAQLVLVIQDEQGQLWRLVFTNVQAFKATTEECAGEILGALPADAGCFQVVDSPWIAKLGDAAFLEKSRHYIVSCYDEVVEVVAWEAEANPLHDDPPVHTAPAQPR